MKYRYAYKTSDGVRHEDMIDADSREGVFAALRARGIKAIKVVAADGSKANGEIRGLRKRTATLIALIAATLAGLAVWWMIQFEPVADPYANFSARERELLVELTKNVTAIREEANRSYADLNVARLQDIETVNNTNLVDDLKALVKSGDEVIREARVKLRQAFDESVGMYPVSKEVLRAAQELYGRQMSALDALEVSHQNRRYAFVLLDANRDKWRIFNGKPAFTDQHLLALYQYCLEGIGADASVIRWRKDFAPANP